MDADDIMTLLEHEQQRQHESVRRMLVESGRLDLATWLDDRLRDVRLGISSAQGAWHALSTVQRRVLQEMDAGRAPKVRLATWRSLSARELVAPVGWAFTPEAAFALTERGRFVVRRGPTPEVPCP